MFGTFKPGLQQHPECTEQEPEDRSPDYDESAVWRRVHLGRYRDINDLNWCSLLGFVKLRHFKLSGKDLEDRFVILYVPDLAHILQTSLRNPSLGHNQSCCVRAGIRAA